MSSAMALNTDQQNSYLPSGYQPSMSAGLSSGAKNNSSPVNVQQSLNGLDKDPSKDGQNGQVGWAAAMEAYYKSTPTAHPPPGGYYAPPMGPHAYMWGPQQMMPPYGSTAHTHYGYGAMYAPQHPSMANHPTTAYGYTTPQQTQTKDGIMMSPANQTGPIAASAVTPVQISSVQDQSNTEGSSGGSDVLQQGMRRNKRSFDTLTSNEAAVMATTASAGNPSQYPYSQEMWTMGAPVQRQTASALTAAEVTPLPYQVIQDERELKRQRRKQSNRESARRSRLRKQAECEDLSIKVNTLTADNTSLRKELSEMQDRCNLLVGENSRLKEQVRKLQTVRQAKMDDFRRNEEETPPVNTSVLSKMAPEKTPEKMVEKTPEKAPEKTPEVYKRGEIESVGEPGETPEDSPENSPENESEERTVLKPEISPENLKISPEVKTLNVSYFSSEVSPEVPPEISPEVLKKSRNENLTGIPPEIALGIRRESPPEISPEIPPETASAESAGSESDDDDDND